MPQHVRVFTRSAGATELFLARAKKGVPQSAVSEATRIPRSRYSQLERGLVEPRLGELEALAEYHQLPIEQVCAIAREALEQAAQGKEATP